MKILLLITIGFCGFACAQSAREVSSCITGSIHDVMPDNDSIYFFNADIDPKYFESPSLSANINKYGFRICNTFSYPHLYRTRFKSEEETIEWRGGYFFIDNSSTKVSIDSIDELSIVEGESAAEFYSYFTPYILKGSKFSSISNMIYKEPLNFELKLRDYAKEYPNSYVALWFLIERFCNEGHSNLRQNILNAFSKRLKKEGLWNIASEDFESIRIKEGKTFPMLPLQDTSLSMASLEIKPAKYTLINYWFSKCKPCIEEIPKLNKLYLDYHKKGLEIISISTDQSKNILNWKDKINTKNLIWPQYLDNNGIEAKLDNIKYFPTNYLLDNKARVIRKNISLEELETLLNQK